METAAINGAAPSSRHGQVRPPMEALAPAVDVLVVGCGPVGATTANLLARHGVKVMVVDRSTEVFMAPRAIALDNEALREHAPAAAFARAEGSIVQVTHRGQRLHLAPRDSWEDLEGVFLPGLVPSGWVAVVRPDRTIVHDGPATDANRIVRESLALLCNPVSAPTLQAEYAIRTA